MIINANKNIDIEVVAPSSKSYSIRAIAAAFLANSTTLINNISFCNDEISALNCIKNLGATINQISSNSVCINSTKSHEINKIINCGESGFCMRMFPFIASYFGKNIRFSREKTLLNRDLSDLKIALSMVGISDISAHNGSEIIAQNAIKAGNYSIDCQNTSQILTGLLFALPFCSSESVISVKKCNSIGYIELTLNILEQFGIKIIVEKKNDEQIFIIHGNQKYFLQEIDVEGDWSAAANLFVLGAISGKVRISGLNINSLQPDKKIYDLFLDLGISMKQNTDNITVFRSEIPGFEFDAKNFPDLIPPLLVLALNAKSKCKIHGINRITNKESNRKLVLYNEFTSLGANIEIADNSYIISPSILHSGEIDSHFDHRIAMAGAVAATQSKGNIAIKNAECVAKSYPNFWDIYQYSMK